MDRTVIGKEIASEARSYILNAAFSVENADSLQSLTQKLQKDLPGVLWVTPKESLHVSLIDLISSSVDYRGDKDGLFLEFFKSQNEALMEVFVGSIPFGVDFNELRVTRDAIILVGSDDGSFKKIRDSLVSKRVSLSGTKPPPKIIHATLCRFIKEVPLSDVSNVLKKYPISFRQEVTNFRLIKTSKAPMQEFEILKEYKLG